MTSTSTSSSNDNSLKRKDSPTLQDSSETENVSKRVAAVSDKNTEYNLKKIQNNEVLAKGVLKDIVKFLLEKNKDIPIDNNVYLNTDTQEDTTSDFELLSNEARICVRAKNREEANIILHLLGGILDDDEETYILESGLAKSKLEKKTMTIEEIIQMISENRDERTVILEEEPEEDTWKQVMELQDKQYSSAGSSLAIITLESLAKYMKL